MTFIFTYDDIRLWTRNFLGIEIGIYAPAKDGGQLFIETPANGILQLLPPGYLRTAPYFSIEDIHATDFTLVIFGPNGSDEILNDKFARYVNYCAAAPFMEVIQYGNILVHLDRLRLTCDIELQSLEFTEEGLVVDFAENKRLYEQLRMLQMFLRAGYKNVYVVSENMPYKGYWFSDGALDYTLRMADHPADIRIWTSFNIPDWLGLAGVIKEDYFPHSYPKEEVYLEFGNVTFTIPFMIAEPEINAETIERNISRLRSEVSYAMIALIMYDNREK